MRESGCRWDFPALERLVDGHPIVYLDNAATSLKPRCVIAAVTDYYARSGVNIHRGKHYLSSEVSDAFESARTRIAEFIGAYGNEIVFVRNTTEALNLVASGLGLERADRVVGCLDSHHSQILPWRRVAHLDLVRVDDEGRVDLDHFRDLLRTRPKVVALTHCSNVTGAVAPIAAMARAAKEACGAIVVVDAAQSLPHQRLDVSRLDIDFLAFSGHKMLGPTGIGCLYGRHAALETLHPHLVGGGTVDWVDREGSRARKVPHRFEAGTPAIASVLGLGAAVAYLARIDAGEQATLEQRLTEAILAGARGRAYLDLVGPREATDRCAIGSFRVRGLSDLSDLSRALSDSYGIMCRSGRLCAQPLVDSAGNADVVRVSAYLYNTVAEIDGFFAALDEIVPLLAGATTL